MSILAGAMSLTVALALGWAWLLPISRISQTLRVGLSYGLGLSWISIAVGIVALLGQPVTFVRSALLIVAPPVSWALWHARRAGCRSWSELGNANWVSDIPPRASRDPWWWGMFALVSALWILVTARALLKPIAGWDAITSYSLKAKAIFVDAAISPSALRWLGTWDYPLGMPLQEVWVGWMVGEWNDLAVKLLFPGYFLALLVIAYAVLRETLTSRRAMAGTLFVAALPFLLQHGQADYTDLPMAYFVVANAATLTLYARSNRRVALALASLCGVGVLLVRADGPLITASSVGLLVVLWARSGTLTSRSTWSALGIYLMPQALVWGIWEVAKLSMGFPHSLSLQSAANISSLDRSLAVVEALLDAMFIEGNWMILWPLFFMALSSRFRDTLAKESLFLVWPVIAYLFGIIAVSIETGEYQFISQETFLNRMVLHVAPLAALWVAKVYSGAWPRAELHGDA